MKHSGLLVAWVILGVLYACQDCAFARHMQELQVPRIEDSRERHSDRIKTPCSNGVKDENEADVDCGESCYALCGLGKTCNSYLDCESR